MSVVSFIGNYFQWMLEAPVTPSAQISFSFSLSLSLALSFKFSVSFLSLCLAYFREYFFNFSETVKNKHYCNPSRWNWTDKMIYDGGITVWKLQIYPSADFYGTFYRFNGVCEAGGGRGTQGPLVSYKY